jgi:hypothetical protein
MRAAALLAVFAALFSLPMARAVDYTQAEVDAGKTALTIKFPNWQKYTDITAGVGSSKKHILGELQRSFYDVAGECLPKGDHLYVAFLDIDLAGQFLVAPSGRNGWREGGRTDRWDLPPHLIFEYALSDAKGQVIKSGKADIKDENYLETRLVSVVYTDPRHYEAQLFRHWVLDSLLKPAKTTE